ncbi:DUF3152 domain-containing protein [Nocardioides dubius]|uniref:DUF3152 domain-containing protein n=1 Tax=Nocardioides dubius TaxID=317019 RepID=A0ABP4E909_9ACTN
MNRLAGFAVAVLVVLLGTAPLAVAAAPGALPAPPSAMGGPQPAADAAVNDAADDSADDAEPLVALSRPRIAGTPRYGRVLRAVAPRWSQTPAKVARAWLRDGAVIKGASGTRLRLRPRDIGHRIQVRYTARDAAGAEHVVRSAGRRALHRVPVRRVVRYSVQTRGRIVADLATFKRLARETFADPRGWRGAGVEFRQVRSGGSMTLVLAEASQVPRFSPACSAQWSCRVGRYVVINQTRWRHASPAWRAGGGTLRNYRHMVVNHESGHFLGKGHRSCPRRGALAPVMQQQSKGLGGCRFNPWPTPAER